MATPKAITCQNIEYESVLALAENFGIHQSTVARRPRDGWSPEEAVGIHPKPKREGHGTSVTYKGNKYPNLKALAEALGIDARTFRARLARGYSLEDAATGNMKPRVSGAADTIDFEGLTYPSKDSLAKAHGTIWSIVWKRLLRGWNMRQAVAA